VQLRLVLPPCWGLRIESIALFADTCYVVDLGEGKCLTQAPNALWAPTQFIQDFMPQEIGPDGVVSDDVPSACPVSAVYALLWKAGDVEDGGLPEAKDASDVLEVWMVLDDVEVPFTRVGGDSSPVFVPGAGDHPPPADIVDLLFMHKRLVVTDSGYVRARVRPSRAGDIIGIGLVTSGFRSFNNRTWGCGASPNFPYCIDHSR
jgi:hypothetical protein